MTPASNVKLLKKAIIRPGFAVALSRFANPQAKGRSRASHRRARLTVRSLYDAAARRARGGELWSFLRQECDASKDTGQFNPAFTILHLPTAAISRSRYQVYLGRLP